MATSEAPWDGSASNYSDSQYESACALDRKSCGGKWADAPAKSRCSLPYKTPQGTVSRAGTHAAASRINQVSDACPEAIASAKAALRSAYKTLGEDPPSSIGGSSDSDSDDKSNSEDTELWQQQRVPEGVPRAGEVAIRASYEPEGWVFREAGDSGNESEFIGILQGHFSVFNRWTEINSRFEGNFMEQIAPGAFTKTFEENRPGMRVLFNHGKDVLGMQTLGPILDLDQDDTGARYEVGLIPTSYNKDLLPGLRHGLYGASFRFQVLRENVTDRPTRSEFNPKGIEERTITEVKVREFGPVTFGQYGEATAGVRSLNEDLLDMDMVLRSMDARRVRLLIRASEDESLNVETSVREEGPGRTTPPPEEGRTAPSPSAPRFNLKRTRTLPSGAARSLRTSRELEEPKWKI